MARSATVTSCARVSTVPLHDVTEICRASPCGNAVRFNMVVAAVSTRNRSFIPDTFTSTVSRRSQFSSWISSAQAATPERMSASRTRAVRNIRHPRQQQQHIIKNERSCYYIFWDKVFLQCRFLHHANPAREFAKGCARERASCESPLILPQSKDWKDSPLAG